MTMTTTRFSEPARVSTPANHCFGTYVMYGDIYCTVHISCFNENRWSATWFWSLLSKATFTRQTWVCKLKLVCVNGTKTVGKHVGKLLATNRTCLYSRQVIVCQHVWQLLSCLSYTPTWVCQHEFANLSLPCEGRLRPLSLVESG